MMWKRILGSVVAILTLSATAPLMASAFAACGVDPPVPAEGWAWPASGPVTNPWSLDCARDSGHRGIDIGVAAGAQITASAGGVVIFIGYTPAESGGTTVSIEHPGGLRTTYLHLTSLEVSIGQNVAQGQILGKSDGRPLHFGLKSTGARERYFNPAGLLSAPATVAPGADRSAPGADLSAQTEPSAELTPAPDVAPSEIPADETGPTGAAGEPGTVPEVGSAPTAMATTPSAVISSTAPISSLQTQSATSESAAPFSFPFPQAVPQLPQNPQTEFGGRVISGLAPWLGDGAEAATAPSLHGAFGSADDSEYRWKTSPAASRTPAYAIALACGVLLIVYAGRGMGRMAGKPVSC